MIHQGSSNHYNDLTSVSRSKWTLIGETGGTNTISYNASLYNEIRIHVMYANAIKYTNTIHVDIIDTTTKSFVVGGYYKNTSACGVCIVDINKNTIKISTIMQNGSDGSNNSALMVYGR